MSAANQAIEQGIVWEDSLLNAEPYNSEVRSTRCYNCLSYTTHIAKYCRSTTRCGWCGQAGHKINDCLVGQDPSKKACAPCGGQRGHYAMDIHCPTRQKDQERARRAYIGRPTRFKDQAAEASLGSTATAKLG